MKALLKANIRRGPSAKNVKLIDHRVRITVEYVDDVLEKWTTTARGNWFRIVVFYFRSYQSCFRINNCVGELNQKYFIQFLFYVGK